jgi:hypothetical protein
LRELTQFDSFQTQFWSLLEPLNDTRKFDPESYTSAPQGPLSCPDNPSCSMMALAKLNWRLASQFAAHSCSALSSGLGHGSEHRGRACDADRARDNCSLGVQAGGPPTKSRLCCGEERSPSRCRRRNPPIRSRGFQWGHPWPHCWG